MAFNIPTTAASAAQVLTNIEKRINQKTPLQLKAFSRVLSVALGFVITGLYKFAAERVKQNLVLTATGVDLERLGADRGVFKKKATAAVLNVQMTALDGTVLPVAAAFIAALNSVRYFNNASATASAQLISFIVTAEDAGSIGNLDVGSVLNIGSQISGADNVAQVVSTLETGVDEEDEEAYRSRVLTAYRAKTGGGNSADYRIWSEEVEGVKAAFPYAGGPLDQVTPTPPERTVYVECTPEIESDGIAPQTLLDAVRANIITNPETGIDRQPLGLTNDTLFVEPISRTAIFIEIVDLQADASLVDQAKNDIKSALDLYFSSVMMFVAGLDFIDDKNDVITIASISSVVNDALQSTGSSVVSVRFGLDANVISTRFVLSPGQLVKTGLINYVLN